MTAERLAEIRERIERDGVLPWPVTSTATERRREAIADRRALLAELDRLRALAEGWRVEANALDESAASWDCHAPVIAGRQRAQASGLRGCARDVLGDRCHMCDVGGPCAMHVGSRP